MQITKILLSISLVALLAAGCNSKPETPTTSESTTQNTDQETPAENTPEQSASQTIEFSKLNQTYKFSGKVPSSWMVEYIPSINSINIYDPANAGSSNLEKSVFFIRNFSANDFLTLGTVDILNRSQDNINGHAAVRYEIKKKPDVAKFSGQPSWRSGQHRLIDIRYEQTNPSLFYVIAYSPELKTEQFESFISSLVFHNDQSSLRYPISNPKERITKKQFGTKVSPTDSPVQPEQFNGYHNGVDFEILPGEENSPILVTALCGGNLKAKMNASGYGGVVTQNCQLNNEQITVIYGHLELASVVAGTNNYLSPGDPIGRLGKGNSPDTDGQRKHLHLGIRKGLSSDIRGYVATEGELLNWIDLKKLLA